MEPVAKKARVMEQQDARTDAPAPAPLASAVHIPPAVAARRAASPAAAPLPADADLPDIVDDGPDTEDED